MLLTVNGQPREVPPGATIAQLLADLKLPARGVAVEVNLQLIPGARHGEFLLSDGDTLEVVSLVGGG